MKKLVIALMATAAVASMNVQAADPAAGAKKIDSCIGCHGRDGLAPAPTFPKLAGQHAMYIEMQLKAFRDGSRKNVTMSPFAEKLSDADISDISAYYGSLPYKK